jgi:hypothetical protein
MIGICKDGKLSWISEESWDWISACKKDMFASENRAVNYDKV